MTNKSKKTLLAFAVVAMMALTTVPTVSAQGTNLEVEVDNPNGRIVPGGEPGTAKIKLIYSGTNPLQPIATGASSSMAVTIAQNCDDSRVKVLGPSTVIIPLNFQDQVQAFGGEKEFNAEVLAILGARGLEPVTCTTSADGTELVATLAPKPTSSPRDWSVTVDYLALLSISVEGRVTQTGPQKETNFPITINNFGNSQTRITFETKAQPENDRWSVSVPDDIILNAEWAADGKQATVQYTILTAYKTGWNNLKGSFTIGMTPIATTGAVNGVNPSGNEVTSNVLVRVKGVFVPGFEPLALLGAVVGTALIARRKD